MTTAAAAPGEGTPASPATPPTEGAAAPAAAAPAPKITNLLPDDGEQPATPPEGTPPVEGAAPAEPKWHYADGTPGKGEPPEWFKATKYKSVEAQAQAYNELEKRFGSFVGAPKDGKYEVPTQIEGVEGEFDTTHPLFDGFQKWAGENQMSQAGFESVLGMLAQYEASKAPDLLAMKAQLGENADQRLQATAAWTKANLDADSYKAVRAIMGSPLALEGMKILEALMSKSRVTLPKPGDDIDGAGGGQLTKANIDALYAAKDAQGRRRYQFDAKYRREVEAKVLEFSRQQEAARKAG